MENLKNYILFFFKIRFEYITVVEDIASVVPLILALYDAVPLAYCSTDPQDCLSSPFSIPE